MEGQDGGAVGTCRADNTYSDGGNDRGELGDRQSGKECAGVGQNVAVQQGGNASIRECGLRQPRMSDPIAQCSLQGLSTDIEEQAADGRNIVHAKAAADKFPPPGDVKSAFRTP